MYLSKLQLFGFKSFAQKTNLKFNDGISCVIGPNGSGKSNIVDAIRWVLGEQRTTLLRSDKMENVLFNGTKQRKPIGMAEVSLTIQNNKNILNTEYNEVLISRRLYRSGESQYLINKTPVRLKDVLDIFMDTGMGANSYSIIELKMVESILSENRQERRQLFEEAAGVVKYKIRRKSALRKLDAARSDLTRVNDIITEVEKNVNSLSRQVGKARRYLAYTEDLKKTDINLSRFRYHRLLNEIRPLQTQLQEASKLKEESHHQITIDEALLEDYKRELIKTEQSLQQINQKLHEQDTNIAQIKQDEAVAQTKSEEITKTKERYKIEIDDFSQKISVLEDNLKHYEDELVSLISQKETFDAQYAEIEKERISEVEKLQSEKTDIDKLNNDFRSNLQLISNEKERLKPNEYQFKFQKEQLISLEKSKDAHGETINSLEKETKRINDEKAALKDKFNQLNNELNSLETKAEKLQNDQRTFENERNQNLSELERAKSRLHFFQQIISNYEGHSQSAKFAMEKKDQFAGLHGPLADIISVDEKYARAVETVLGDSLNFIIVDNTNTAKKLIQIVKEQNKGRITLIPLDRVKEISNVESPADTDQITVLSELIQCDNQYKNLVNLLLGDAAIVDTLEEALIQSKNYPQLRFITLSGEMVNFNREVSGGSIDKKGTAIIGRHDQLQKYAKEVEHFQSILKKLENKLADISKLLKCNKDSQDQVKEKLSQQQNEIIEFEKIESQVLYEINKHKNDQQDDGSRLTQLQDNIKELEETIGVIQNKVENQQQELNLLEKETILRTNEYEQKSDSLQALLEEVQKSRLNVTNLQNQVTNRQNDISRSQRMHKELQDNTTKRKDEIEQIDQLLIQLENDSQKRRDEQIKIWELRDQYENERNQIERQLQELKDKIVNIEDQAKTYRKQHDSTLERSRSLEIRVNENRYKAESIREYILKEYSEDIEIGIPYDGLDEQESEDKIESLKNRIKNLGLVNPLAVSEYEKEKERFDFLSKQRDDLLKAETSLMETIEKINTTARKQFIETFTAIKKNFEKVFQSFFENGEGTIKLEESIDPLEADIEINVSAKGKRLQTLALLSGGEKTLTAISLLFSIYLVKPSPFCVLDEVDAPLDDVNILRFTDALKNYSNKTQFIVVTHNKRTMEAAQTMYGVTMEEEGISKLVSVKFN